MKPFIYAHELISNNAGIWIGCNDRDSVVKSHTEGETGEEVVALYHEKDYKELLLDLIDLKEYMANEAERAHSDAKRFVIDGNDWNFHVGKMDSAGTARYKLQQLIEKYT